MYKRFENTAGGYHTFSWPLNHATRELLRLLKGTIENCSMQHDAVETTCLKHYALRRLVPSSSWPMGKGYLTICT